MPPVDRTPQQSRFSGVRAATADLDAAGLAAAAGALALLPANAHRLWRLGALATLASERPGGGGSVGQGQLRPLVSGGDLAALADMQDDPYEDILTEEVAFSGGSYLVSSGLAQDAAHVLRLLTRAVLLRPLLPDDLRGELTQLCFAGLRLCDHVLRAAGLRRYQEPAAPPAEGLEVPGGSRLRHLMELCTFDDSALAAIGIFPDDLDPLVVQGGERHFSDEQISEGLADRWPLVRFEGRLVLARPLALPLALRHRVIARTVEEVGRERVAEAFAAEVQADVLRSLRRMGIRARVARRRNAEQEWSELEAELDTDLRLVCAVVPDAFAGLSDDAYGMVDMRRSLEQAQSRFEERAGEAGGEMLGLLVIESAGRAAVLGLRAPEAPGLVLEHISGADLELLGFLEQDDELALWKFARDRHTLLAGARVQSFSTLDTYSVWLAEERSLTPLSQATLVVVPPGAGGELRRGAKRSRDRHGALYVDGSVREVERERDEGFGERVYHVTDINEPHLLLHVAGAPVDIWVSGPEGGEAVRDSWDLVQTVAFWLSELVEGLGELLAAMRAHTPCLRVDVDVADRAFWFEGGPEPDQDPGDRIEVEGPTVRLVLGASLRRAAPAPDNAGERDLVVRLLEALDALAVAIGLEPLSGDGRAALVEEVAPSGLKKHLLIFPAHGNELLAVADGPLRQVQQADVTAARELLGAHLVEHFGLEPGPVPDEQREAVLDEAVEFLLAQVRVVMDETRADGLLNQLLAANERIIAASELRHAMLPARAATYPAAVDQRQLRQQIASSAQAAVACRFLAEYVVAQPPVGQCSWSLVRYDRAMGLVAEMLDWAYLNDALHYRMSDVGLMINSDGQLRLQERDRYEQGRSVYFDVHIADQRAQAERIFLRRFETSTEAEPSEIRARVDPLMVQEAGASLTELGELLHAAAWLARRDNVDVLVLERGQALDTLAGELGWERAKVERAVSYLSMGARPDFLRPPGGSWRDVVPSRFARRFSLNRRPLLECGDELLWGQRQPLTALRVLLGQIFTGRFQSLAQTPELRAELSRLEVEAGHRFEHEVAEIFDAGPRLIVREGVTVLDGVAVERENGDALGDIDVLAADTVTEVLYAVECKDLAGALTPSEVAGELSEHFRPDTGTSTSRHGERVAWLEGHRAEALRELGLAGPPERWQVKGLFVTGQRAMAPYIADLRFEIVGVDDLEAWIAARPRPRSPMVKRRARRS